MRLSKLGYGDIVTVKNLDVKTFIDLINYEEYQEKYMKAFRDMNRKK